MRDCKSADPLGVSEGTFPPLVSSLTHSIYSGQGNVAQVAVDYRLGGIPTVIKRGGGGSPQLKTDTPSKDSRYGLQQTIGFCNVCFASAIGVLVFWTPFSRCTLQKCYFCELLL